jgi:hypothetical protein
MLIVRYAICAAGICGFGAPTSATAHDFMTAYVDHAVRVVVGPSNIDITVELTFNELVSLEERKRMDRDRDGWINEGEIASYLSNLGPALTRGMELTIGRRSVPVLELYDPQLDLLGAKMVAPAHHILHLAFFARTPSSFSTGRQQIVLHDNLWADAPAICSFQVEGTGAIQVEMTSPRKILSNPGVPGADRSIQITSETVPASSSRRGASN